MNEGDHRLWRADPAAFQAEYGSNGNGKNAFGKCVSSKVEDAAEDEDEGDLEVDDTDDDAGEELPIG